MRTNILIQTLTLQHLQHEKTLPAELPRNQLFEFNQEEDDEVHYKTRNEAKTSERLPTDKTTSHSTSKCHKEPEVTDHVSNDQSTDKLETET